MIDVKNIIDISWPITEDMTSYKDVRETAFQYGARFEEHGYRKSTITLSTHAGTHVDAPSHFLKNGVSINQVPLQSFIGLCTVLDLMHVEEKVTVADLATHSIVAGDIILLRTKNSGTSPRDPFDARFIFIDLHAARYLAEKKIRAIGVDYLGIERHQPGHETHDAFLSNGIGLIEGLRLAHVKAGRYFLCCLPLALQGLDGAPARAVLLEF